MTEARVRDLLFVLRCSAAATLSILLAEAIGLPHPVWAAMSGVIVSQDRLGDTQQATIGRFLGTLTGVAIAVTVGLGAVWAGVGKTVEVAIAVALAAIIARRWPVLKVCMWTCPIVFLTATPGTPIWEVGLYRGSEVLLGGAVGAVLHVVSEAVIRCAIAPQGVAESPAAGEEQAHDGAASATKPGADA